MANYTDWLNISAMSGESGETILTLIASPNTTSSAKTATVKAYNTIYNISAATQVSIAYPVIYPIPYTADTSEIDATGETRTIVIDATGLIESSITVDIQGAVGATYTYENGVITVTFPENNANPRDIVVTVTGNRTDGNIGKATIHYHQGTTLVTKVMAIYNVTSTTDPTAVAWNFFNTPFINNFSKVEYNGIDITSGLVDMQNSNGVVLWRGYTFPTTGLQTLYLTLARPQNISECALRTLDDLVLIVIPEGVTTIEEGVFMEDYALSSVTLPSTLITIGKNAFLGCSSLSSITIPQSVETLGISSFNACVNLRNITIPSGVTLIQQKAFNNCSGLTKMTFESTVPPVLSLEDPITPTDEVLVLGPTGYTFPIYVPCESVNAYKTAPIWTNYAHRIKCNDSDLSEYLTFEILSSGSVKWVLVGDISNQKTIQYRKNNGEWINIISNVLSAATSIEVEEGDTIQFRGNNTSYASGANNYNTFRTEGCSVNVKGNIMSLINSTDFISATTLTSDWTFAKLFIYCFNLIDASKLWLPALTLTNNCYYWMFNGTSITSIPELPATTLAANCYTGMFYGCTSLNVPAGYILPATTLANTCYSLMFGNCTGLTQAPELPATTLLTGCYNNMFAGCTSLTIAPELPATTLKGGCYAGMFYGCTSLIYIKCLATDISAYNCTGNWVNGVSATGTFIKDSSTTWSTGTSGIPSGWTVQDA